jgi:AsmA protein
VLNTKRPHVLIPAAIAILAVAAFAVLWLGARTEYARGVAARVISDRVGLATTVERLRVGFFPSPSAELGGIEIAQPPGFGTEPFLSVGRLRLELPWGSIFGRARLDAVEVSEATARLAVGADGVPNWSKLASPPPAGEGAAPAKAADWFLGALDVDHGVIDYRDAVAGSAWQIAAIAVSAQGVAPAADFPLEIRLAGVFGPNTIHYAASGQAKIAADGSRYEAMKVEFRGWAGGDPLPLAGVELTGALARAAYESETGVATLDAGRFVLAGIPGTFAGRLDMDEPALAAEFQLSTEPFAPRAPAVAFGRALPVTTDPTAFESLQVALQARLADGELAIEPVSGRLDDTNFEGQAVPSRRFFRAALDRIDFNRYLPPAAKTAPQKKRTLEDAVAALAQFDLDAEIRIGEAKVAGATMRDVLVRVEPDGEHSP